VKKLKAKQLKLLDSVQEMSVYINQVHHTDFLKLAPNIPDKSIDCIFADPPFGIGFNSDMKMYNRKTEHVCSDYNEVSEDNYERFTYEWVREAKRVLKSRGVMYIVSGWSNFEYVLRAIRLAKLHRINNLVWEHNFAPYTKNKFVSSHYLIEFVSKQKTKYNFFKEAFYPLGKKGSPDSQNNYAHRCSVTKMKKDYLRGHKKCATKLPDELVRKYLGYAVDFKNPDKFVVLDPFTGNATVPKICIQQGVKFIACDISKQAYELGKLNIERWRNEYGGNNTK